MNHRWIPCGFVLAFAFFELAQPLSAQCWQGEIPHSEPDEEDFFGYSMDGDGRTLVIGTNRWDGRGSVTVFELIDDTWVETQRITGQDTLAGGAAKAFGQSIAVSGDWMAVSDPSASVSGHLEAGMVHIFNRDGGVWVASQAIAASDLGFKYFGNELSIQGRFLAVGSPYAGPQTTGAVYMFHLVGSSWAEMQKISGTITNSLFGSAVAVDDPWLVVGAPNEFGVFLDGHAYAYLLSGTGPEANWILQQTISGGVGEALGADVALEGNTVLIGSPGFPDFCCAPTNRIFAYEISPSGAWSSKGTLTPSDEDEFPWTDEFGGHLALSGDDLIVGAPLFSIDNYWTGAAYHYRRIAGTWSFAGKLAPGNLELGDRIGQAVAISGGLAVIGSPWRDWDCSGPFGFCYAPGTAHAFKLGVDATQFCSCPSSGPCGNNDGHGGCLNSVGEGAVLAACGTGSVTSDDLQLEARWLPSGTLTMLFMGTTEVQVPFGDGLLCVNAGNEGLFRFPVRTSSHDGVVAYGPGLAGWTQLNHPPAGWLQAGQTWSFQARFRDPLGPCGTDTNLTNAVRVSFVP